MPCVPEHILSKFLPPSGEGNNSNQSVSKKSNSKKINKFIIYFFYHIKDNRSLGIFYFYMVFLLF